MFFLSQSPEHNYHARPAFAIRSARWHAEQMSLTPPKYITNCAHCDRQMQISGYYSILKFSGRLDINQGNGGVDFAGEARQSVSVKNEYQTIVYCLHFCQWIDNYPFGNPLGLLAKRNDRLSILFWPCDITLNVHWLWALCEITSAKYTFRFLHWKYLTCICHI